MYSVEDVDQRACISERMSAPLAALEEDNVGLFSSHLENKSYCHQHR